MDHEINLCNARNLDNASENNKDTIVFSFTLPRFHVSMSSMHQYTPPILLHNTKQKKNKKNIDIHLLIHSVWSCKGSTYNLIDVLRLCVAVRIEWGKRQQK